MKIHTLASLKKLVREQSYKMASLRGPDGTKVVPFNKYKKTAPDLDPQFKIFETRLKSEICPDGVYCVLLAHNINASRAPHEFYITKGNVSADQVNNAKPQNVTIEHKGENALSWANAVEMNAEISKLTAKVAQLEFEKAQLLKQLADYEEEEEEISEAQNSPANNVATMFKEAIPGLMGLAEKYFEQNDRRLNLEEMKYQKKRSVPMPNGSPAKKMVPIGSQEHLDYIEKLFNDTSEASEELFNVELDKLEKKNPDLYSQVLQRLGLTEEEEEQEDTNE